MNRNNNQGNFNNRSHRRNYNNNQANQTYNGKRNLSNKQYPNQQQFQQQHYSTNSFKDPNDTQLQYSKGNNAIDISDISQFPTPPTYSSLDLAAPTLLTKIQPLDLNNTPEIKQERPKPCALLKQSPLDVLNNILTPSFNITKNVNEIRSKKDQETDPILKIIRKKRENLTQYRFGDVSFDIVSCVSNFTKSTSTSSVIKPINKNNTSNTDQFSTPVLKRHRDELLIPDSIGNSSIKKNKRPLTFASTPHGSNDTMDLSFEGKAMDKSELIRLVNGDLSMDDSSVLIGGVSGFETPAGSGKRKFVDTRELLKGFELQEQQQLQHQQHNQQNYQGKN